MNEQELLYSMALTLLPGVSKAILCDMIKRTGSAVDAYDFFRVPNRDEDVPERLAELVRKLPEYLVRAQKELDFCREKDIRVITLMDDRYPSRLRECPDAPIVLYYKGTADLNALHVVSMVGTRRCTEYGRDLCRTFLRDLKSLCPDALVVSGLAYGIDVNSHQNALQNNLQTIGVLAHGLDMIYPSSHKHIANEMVNQGGLLTEFMSGSNSDRFHFVQRNRIVAGMSDATIVVESKEHGGSLITAELAQMYYRDVFACPGRVTDPMSKGCNQLIQSNRASILLSAFDFVQAMGWQNLSVQQPIQRQLFVDLSPQEEMVVQKLKDYEPHSINSLVVSCNVPIQQMHELLFELELKGVIKSMVGNQYRLLS